MTPAERRLKSRIGALTVHSRTTPYRSTEKALKARWEGYLKQADPDGLLSEEERNRRATKLEQIHMARMSLLAIEARRKKKVALQQAAKRRAAREAKKAPDQPG